MMAVKLPQAPSKQEIVARMDYFLQQHPHLRIACVTDDNEFDQVKALRLKVYNGNLPYMLNQMDPSGADEYDDRSFVFAIWHEEMMVASIRLTPFPYETYKYLDANRLIDFLGAQWKSNYVEWSRMLVDTSFKIKGLVNTLTIFAGLYILANTGYTDYFGYTRPHVKRLLARFKLDNRSLAFTIPSRGDHEYLLIKGSFLHDFINLDTPDANTSLLSFIGKK